MNTVTLENILKTPNGSDIGYTVDVKLKIYDSIENKTTYILKISKTQKNRWNNFHRLH